MGYPGTHSFMCLLLCKKSFVMLGNFYLNMHSGLVRLSTDNRGTMLESCPEKIVYFNSEFKFFRFFCKMFINLFKTGAAYNCYYLPEPHKTS